MHFDITTILAVIATSLISPSVLAYFTNRARRADKKLDWAREDDVAERAKQTARLLVENNERVARTSKETNLKLDQIHTLVNSNMTAAMRAELEATIQKLKLMREIVARDKADNITVLPEALRAIKDVEMKIGELTATLNDRLRQTEIAEEKLQQQQQQQYNPSRRD